MELTMESNGLGRFIESMLPTGATPLSFGVGGAFAKALTGNSTESLVQSVVPSAINSVTKAGLTGQQIAQNEWTAQREDSQYQRLVDDLQKAGLNPAMLFGKSAQPVSSPSAGDNGASVAGSFSNMLELAGLAAKIKNINADTARMNADTNRIVADTSNIEADTARIIQDTANKFVEGERMEFDLDFLRSTRSLDIRAKELANNLSQAEFDKIYQWIDESIERVNLIQQQEQTEEVKRVALAADAILKYAQANEIAQLMEYKKLLMTSQANANNASAALSTAHAAWQNGLLDRNVLDAIASTYFSDADSADARAEVNKLAAALRNPSYNYEGITNSGFARHVFAAMESISDMLPFSASTKIN